MVFFLCCTCSTLDLNECLAEHHRCTHSTKNMHNIDVIAMHESAKANASLKQYGKKWKENHRLASVCYDYDYELKEKVYAASVLHFDAYQDQREILRVVHAHAYKWCAYIEPHCIIIVSIAFEQWLSYFFFAHHRSRRRAFFITFTCRCQMHHSSVVCTRSSEQWSFMHQQRVRVWLPL